MARKSSVLFIKKWGNRIIIVAIILEMFFWPSLENLAGCGMTWICWSLFRKIGLNETIIKEQDRKSTRLNSSHGFFLL